MADELDNIWVACSNGDIERVQYLITQEGVSVNAQDDMGYSPMHAAASYGEIAILEFLFNLGGDVHIRDHDGDTPLLVSEVPAVFELLAQLGADVNAKNAEGQGIVEKVLEDENGELFEYLIERGMVTDQAFIAKHRGRLGTGDYDADDAAAAAAAAEIFASLGAIDEENDEDEMNV